MNVVFLDNGHGSNTIGKRSPDGKFREYRWTRKMATALKPELEKLGIKVELSCPEETDTPLSKRVQRINKYCNTNPKDKVIVVSIHNNAASSDGKWHNAAGWCCYSTRGKTKSDGLAECFYDAAEKYLELYKDIVNKGKLTGDYDSVQKHIRMDKSDGDRDFEANFYIIYKTVCPSILVENMFQDTKKDVEFLESEAGFKALLNLHIEGIKKYFGL